MEQTRNNTVKITEEIAYKIVDEFRAICKKHDLWISVKTEEKPDLKMIRIEEISIKIDK